MELQNLLSGLPASPPRAAPPDDFFRHQGRVTKVIAEEWRSVSLLLPTCGLRTPLIEFAMLFSYSSSYAIRALTYLAMQPPGRLAGTREISAHEGIPHSFLGKVLIQLRRGRLLRSYKGIGGGYELAVPPDRINLLMVVRCTDGEDFFEACILDNRDCSSQLHCALHKSWFEIRDRIKKMLEENTLVQLVQAREANFGRSPEEMQISVGLPDHQGV